MTSETSNLHVVKNLNISKTEKDIEKLKTPLRLVWKCCSDAFQIGSTIFRHRGTLSFKSECCRNCRCIEPSLPRHLLLASLRMEYKSKLY